MSAYRQGYLHPIPKVGKAGGFDVGTTWYEPIIAQSEILLTIKGDIVVGPAKVKASLPP